MQNKYPASLKVLICFNVPDGRVPGHAGEQWSRGLRPGGAEGDGSVLLRTDCEAAAHQVELGGSTEVTDEC